MFNPIHLLKSAVKAAVSIASSVASFVKRNLGVILFGAAIISGVAYRGYTEYTANKQYVLDSENSRQFTNRLRGFLDKWGGSRKRHGLSYG